jgi:hypothetical protein
MTPKKSKEELKEMNHYDLQILLFSLLIKFDTYDLRRLIKYIYDNFYG